MKMTIEWHENCLKAQYGSLERDKKQLEELQNKVVRQSQECTFYHAQIHEAKHKGKESFDRERYIQHVKYLYFL